MQIINRISQLKNFNIINSVCSIGTYDGIHKGHKKILSSAKQISEKNNLPFIVITFNNLPAAFIKNKTIKRILPLRFRHKIFKSLGIDYLIELNFNEHLMNIEPYDFIKNILIDKLRMKYLFVGFNFKFGHKSKGNVELLKKYSNEFSFLLNVTNELFCNGKSISSTYIRKLLAAGKVSEAGELLGYSPIIYGKIVKGKQLGSKIGYPTINIFSDDKPIIKTGVYKTETKINNHIYKSVTNIGNNPTFNEKDIQIETYILNFNKNVYDKYAVIYFINQIRNEKNFNSVDELKQQIKKDINAWNI